MLSYQNQPFTNPPTCVEDMVRLAQALSRAQAESVRRGNPANNLRSAILAATEGDAATTEGINQVIAGVRVQTR